MNRLEIIAVLAERDVLRFTPAGVPVVSAKLQHNSEQVEAGIPRQVSCEMAAIAAGEISGRLARAELGSNLRFIGFLARKSRASKGLIFHISHFETISDIGA